MTIKEHIYNDCPYGTEYEWIISTDSAIEREVINKFLSLAQEDYSNWIRKFTKGE